MSISALRRFGRVGVGALAAVGAGLVGVAIAPSAAASIARPAQPPAEPWFGVPLPPGFDPEALPVLGQRPAVPATVPAGEDRFEELDGSAIRAHLEGIVAFSRRSRETRELGDGQIWGRVTGFPSGNDTVAWAAERFREAGLENVQLQAFSQDEGSALWLPLSWEVRLPASPAFGVGSRDVVLESAMPLSQGSLPPEGRTAPLVYVGTATPAELATIDVRGKIAVQKATPQGHTVFLRAPVGPRAQDLLDRGAAAVLTVLDLPGNLRSRDIGCGGRTCFNLGGRDGLFLESVLSAAVEHGTEVRASLRLASRSFSGLSSHNAVAVLRGTRRPDEFIVINAHADAWFDGAGDNGDGLAVLVALARHFARPEMRPERSLVFVASAGHHSPGLSGPGHFVAMNPEIVSRTVLVVNLEHTSQRNLVPARSLHPDGYREWTMDAHEAPIVAGISNAAPFLEGLVEAGIRRYGVNFVAEPSSMASGEGGAYLRAGLPVFTTMQGSPMYHTTGEVLDMVSTPGLQRIARFLAFLAKEVAKAPASSIAP